MINKFSRYSLIIALLLVLQACQPEQDQAPSGLDSSGISTATEQVTVNGVSSKGPIAGASIEIIQFNASDGAETSTVLATTTTDSSGNWSVNIPAASHTVPLLIKSSGGEFLDESDTNPDASLKRKITLASNEYLLGVLFPGHNTASVTMLTHAFIQKSRIESSVSGNFLNVLSNNRSIASSGLGFDPFTVAAANPLSPSVSASVDSIEYAMYLGGLATALNSSAIKLGIPVPTYSVIAGMVADLSDGDLDGANQNGVVMLDVGNGSVAFPSDNNLNNAITRFRNNNYAAYSVTPVSQVITINESALTVSGVNNDPVAFDDSYTTVANASIVTGNVLSNDTDPDGDALAVSSVIQPANGVVVNNGNGTFNFTPTSGFTGNAVFSYSISDGHGGSDTAQVIVTVTAAPSGGTSNTPPVAEAGATQTVNQAVTVNLSGSGSDSDGTISSYLWTQIDTGYSVTLSTPNAAATSFTAPTPPAGQTATLIFELQVTDDDGSSDSDTVLVQVNSTQTVAIPPTANAGADQSVDELTTVNLSAAGSSDDGSIVSYAWTQTGLPAVTLSNSSTATPSFTAPAAPAGSTTTLFFELQVTDNDGLSDTDIVSIVVNSTQAAGSDPVANAGPDQTAQEQTAISLDATASVDDGSIVSYFWTQTGGSPIIALANAATATPSFTGPNIATDTTFTFAVIVTDDQGNTDTDTVNINLTAIVAEPNSDPVAVTDDVSTNQGITLNYIDVLANDTDPDNDPVILIGVTQPANGSATNNGDGTVTYVPDLAFNGVDSFSYSVIDGQGGTATGTVNVTVEADSDGDGLLDSYEISVSLDPNDPDFDNDGFYDGHEMLISGTAAYQSNETPPGTVIDATNSTIATPTVWSLANSPYWVQSDVTVQGGASLVIEAGVVVKFDPGTDLFVAGDADLNIMGHSPIPQNVRFTSITDDSLNGNTGSVVGTPAAGNWSGIDFQANSRGDINHLSVRYAVSCIEINNASPALKGVEMGDCSGYGMYTYSSSTSITSYLRDIRVVDFDLNGIATGNIALLLESTNATTNTLDIANVTIDQPGSGYYGLQIYAHSSANISGSIDQVDVTNASSYPIYLYNTGTGNVSPTLSNISISTPENTSIAYLYINNTNSGTLAPQLDGINTIVGPGGTANAAIRVDNASPVFLDTGSWSVSNVGYGMILNNASGVYNNINMDATQTAGLQLLNASAPTVFNNVVLTNASTPYELVGQTLNPTITGGYDFSDPSVSKAYIRINGNILADMTLTADPLNTGSSAWRVNSSITIPAGVAMTIHDDAIVKFDLNTYLYVNGTLTVADTGSGLPAILTSIRDDSVGDDLGDAIPPAWSDWGYIQAGASSVIAIDNAEIRYADYGLYQSGSQPASISVSNTVFRDIYYYGLYLYVYNTEAVDWTLNNVEFDRVGVNTSYHAIYARLAGSASLTGSWFNLTMNNIGGSGIYIDDSSTGAFNPTISGLTMGDTGTIGSNGVQLIGDSTTTPTFDASSGFGNSITGGTYNLTLQGVGGSYSDLTLAGAGTASIYLSGGANPTVWDDASIVLNSSPSPFIALTSFPASIGVYGTTDQGYNTTTSTVTRNYVATGGTLANTNYAADPLNTGSSVYRVISNITVPAGVTMTVQDGAVLKFNPGLLIYVDGSLIVGDQNNDGVGANAVFTSIRDDSVGGDTNGDLAATSPNWNDWNYINARAGAVIDIDNAIIRYSSYGLYQYSAQTTSVDITNSAFSNVYYYGLFLQLYTGQDVSWNLDNVSITDSGINTSYHGMFLQTNNDSTFSGTLNNVSLNNIGGTGLYLEDNSTGVVNPVISGLTVGDTGSVGIHGVQLIGSATTVPTFDASSGNTNSINGGTYNLTLQGVSGNFSNLTLSNATANSVYFSGTANPLSWDDATVVINSAPSPYMLLVNLPVSVGVLGTNDLGYDVASSSVSSAYVSVASTLGDLTLVEDPLNTGSGASVYRITSSLTVPAGVTLTVQDGAVLKFHSGLILYVDGSLIVGDGDGAGNNAVFTTIEDDSIGGDTNGDGTATGGTRGDWNYISVRGGAIIDIDNAIVRYANYGIYHYNAQPTSFSITNSSFTDIYYYALQMQAYATQNVAWTMNSVDIFNSGVNTTYHGIYLQINAGATFTGSLHNLSLNNIGGSGIYLEDNSTGIVNPNFSGLSIGDSGTVGVHGIQLIGDATTTPTFDASSGSGNSISAGTYNLTLQGVSGSYSNLNLTGATTSALYFSDATDPLLWDSASITLDNAPTPFTLIGMNLPAQFNGYQAGAGLAEDYVIIRGALISDVDLSADPLGSGSSVWYVSTDLTVGALYTLTVGPGTVVKAVDGVDIFIDGTFNVTASAGQEAVFTDIRDDSYNGDSNGDGNGSVAGGGTNWQGIDFRDGSQGTVNYLVVEQSDVAIQISNAGDASTLTFANLVINNVTDGLYLYQTSATLPTSPEFTNLSITNASSQHLYLDANNTTNGALMQPSFSGNLLISGGGTDGVYCTYAGPNFNISGFTIEGTQDGVDLYTGCTITLENNLIRDASTVGVRISSSAAPIVRNNIVVNNGTANGGNNGGIYANSSGVAFINSNLIRQNQASYGAGIMVRDSSPVIQNNLIIENQSSDGSAYGGSGIFVWNNSSPTLLNNTVAGNVSANSDIEGGGIHIGVTAGNTVTMLDNLVYGNTDVNGANDVYWNGVATLTENFNLIGAHNLALAGTNDIEASDPLFSDGWYLNVLALDGGSGDSPAIDAGSDLASNSATGAGTVVLTATTTRTDGANEGVASQVDIGYHYPANTAAPLVDAAASTVSPLTFDENPNSGGTQVLMTVTPRDAANQILGAGLVVTTTQTDGGNIGAVRDRGDGSYQVIYTLPTGSGTDTIGFVANGVALDSSTTITWTQ